MECFQNNIFHSLCTCCEFTLQTAQPWRVRSPMHYYLSPCLLCEHEIVPNKFNNSLGQAKMPLASPRGQESAGFVHGITGFAFLNISAVVPPFLQECQGLPGICDSPTSPCKRYLRGVAPM